jgi:hypothetical protein
MHPFFEVDSNLTKVAVGQVLIPVFFDSETVCDCG